MKIKDIIWQSRRDFDAIYECQFCGHTVKGRGYDDQHFHTVTIPNMICETCGKSVNSEGPGAVDYRPLQPKYPEGYQI